MSTRRYGGQQTIGLGGDKNGNPAPTPSHSPTLRHRIIERLLARGAETMYGEKYQDISDVIASLILNRQRESFARDLSVYLYKSTLCTHIRASNTTWQVLSMTYAEAKIQRILRPE